MQPEIINDCDINPTLDAAIKKTLCLCFPKDRAIFSQTREWHGSGPAYCAIIEKNGNVIAYVGVVDRTVKIGKKDCRIAGVQNVCVLPEHRGKGYGDAILQAAMQEAAKRDFDCGLLFTNDIIKKVYARNGWLETKRQKFIRIEDDGKIKMREGVKMYYPLKLHLPKGTVNLQGNDW